MTDDPKRLSALEWTDLYERLVSLEYLGYGGATDLVRRALDQRLADHDRLAARVSSLVQQLDALKGTPCEQIRHEQQVETLRARVAELEREVERLRPRVDTLMRTAKAWECLYNERNRLWRNAEDRLDRVRALLEQNGCDCECDHGTDDHAMSCGRCFACRIQGAIE